MRDKYKVAMSPVNVGRSSLSPVFSLSSPESPGSADQRSGWAATPKQRTALDSRHELLQSRSVAVRSVVGKPHDAPSPVASHPRSAARTPSVAFSSSEDDDPADARGPALDAWMQRSDVHPDVVLAGRSPDYSNRTPPPRPPNTRTAARRVEPAHSTAADAASYVAAVLHDREEEPQPFVRSLSAAPPSLLDEAEIHKMVSRLEGMFGETAVHDRLTATEATRPRRSPTPTTAAPPGMPTVEGGGGGDKRSPVLEAWMQRSDVHADRTGDGEAAPGPDVAPATAAAPPRTPLAPSMSLIEKRYELLERLHAEKSDYGMEPYSPSVWVYNDAAFGGTVPPYGEAYAAYSTISTARGDTATAATPTLRTSHPATYSRSQRRRPTSASLPRFSHRHRQKKKNKLPAGGAEVWRESAYVRGSQSRYTLYRSPMPGAPVMGSVRTGQQVEVLRTERVEKTGGGGGGGGGNWVLLAQGGWMRVTPHSFTTRPYGQWVAQGGLGANLAAETAVLERIAAAGQLLRNGGRSERLPDGFMVAE